MPPAGSHYRELLGDIESFFWWGMSISGRLSRLVHQEAASGSR
jgi:hypothetical protein